MTYKHQNQNETADTILKHVAFQLDLTPETMTARNRKRPLVEARMIYCLICQDHAPVSIIVSVIGEVMKRDHVTALYNLREGRSLAKMNRAFATKYERVLESYKTNVLLQFEHYNYIPQY